MPLTIPTTQEITDQAVSKFETALGQTVPIPDRAFIRVLSGVFGMLYTGLYKFLVERAKQSLALTATGSDLDIIGENYGVTRLAAVPAVLTIQISGTAATSVPQTVTWVGDSNNVRYTPSATVVIGGGGTVNSEVTAQTAGSVGSLAVGAALSLSSPLSGVVSATVVSLDVIGTDRETDEAYRRRVLNEIRTVGGGGNGVDYRTWAEAVEGVASAYPYSGKPVDGSLGTSEPGDRTVFIEAVDTIDPDGVAPQSLLDTVKDEIQNDPDTGLDRPPLGFTESTLFVLSITRTGIYIEVRGLDVSSSVESACRADIETALGEYLDTVRPYVEGTDPAISKNNVVTDMSLSKIVYDVVSAYGGTADGIGFATVPSIFIDKLTLGQGELLKLQSVSYA